MWTPGRRCEDIWRYPGSHTRRQGFRQCMEKIDLDLSGREETQIS